MMTEVYVPFEGGKLPEPEVCYYFHYKNGSRGSWEGAFENSPIWKFKPGSEPEVDRDVAKSWGLNLVLPWYVWKDGKWSAPEGREKFILPNIES